MIKKTYGALQLILALCTFFMGSRILSAKSIFVSQSGFGNNNGTSPNDSYSLAWLNAGGNWGGGATQVNPGDTVHLLGTFTMPLTVAGSGSANNSITIYFEAGANFTSPCWDRTGAIALNGQSYIIVDGGLNGLIQNTNNGVGFGASNNSTGVGGQIFFGVIQNLTITNIFYRIAGNDPNVAGNCITISGGPVTVSNCSVSDACGGIGFSGPQPGDPPQSNIFILNNRILNWNHGISTGIGNSTSTNSNCLLTNIVIAGNFLDHCDVWDGYPSSFHMDGIIILNNTQDNSVVINGLRIFQNTWGPNFKSPNVSAHGQTAGIAEYLDGGVVQCQNTYIYNNLFEAYPSNAWANGFINANGSNIWVVNNTCATVGGAPVAGGVAINLSGTNAYCYNNLLLCAGSGITMGTIGENFNIASIVNNGTNNLFVLTKYFGGIWSDYNVYTPDINGFNSFSLGLQASMASSPVWLSGIFNSVDRWRTYINNGFNWPTPIWNAAHCDPHSTTNLPRFVAGSFVPTPHDTVARNAGTNLYWLGITNDFNGNPRLASDSWDIGAFSHAVSSGNSIIGVPGNLRRGTP